jgi:hypothetical protein
VNQKRLLRLIVAMIALWASPAYAVSLLVSQGAGTTVNDANYYYGGSRWSELTNEINATFATVTVVPNLNNLSQLLAYDRLWIDQRWVPSSLGATELANIQSFIATGRRLVMIGENNSWTNWDNQILGLVGGTYAGESRITATPTTTHPELTAGVVPIPFPQNSYGTASGGEPLFDTKVATLWNGQAVTVLDVSIFTQNDVGTSPRFRQNVIAWLAVPEPASGILAIVALGTATNFIRRRKQSSGGAIAGSRVVRPYRRVPLASPVLLRSTSNRVNRPGTN